MLKYLYILLGSVALFLGIVGIFTPGLPTTPFILLTGFFYARSSPKLYGKLENNKITGSYLKRVKGGLSLKYRLVSIVLMWVMISFTTFVIFQDKQKLQYLMLALGVVGTISQLVFLKKRKLSVESSVNKENIG